MITGKAVFAQLKCDLIGKDSWRGVSLTYAWLANQFGHFSLGFIPCLLLYSLLHRYAPPGSHALWAALLVTGFWVLFETGNFLGPLLGGRYPFPPAWGNIAFDTVTDVSFFSLGAFAAALFLSDDIKIVLVLALLLSGLSYPVYYWYLTKMYIQEAQYPYQFRLSQFTKPVSEADKAVIQHFMQSCVAGGGRHLLVFGAKNSGKTSLSIGIATEMSIRRHACLYTTAMKQSCLFYDNDMPFSGNSISLWNWRSCSLLVIDDFNPGLPVKEELISPAAFLQWLDAGTAVTVNRQLMREKNVIWVMGNLPPEATSRQWHQMLAAIGVPDEHVLSMHL